MNLSFFLDSRQLGDEARRLVESAAKVQIAADVQVKALAETVQRVYTGIARGEAPRRKGTLGAEIKGEIKSVPGGLMVSFSSTPYTRYVIEGTGLYHKPDAHGMIVPKKAKALRFEIGGQVIYRTSVKGQKANPFQVRAWERSQPGIQAALKLAGKEVLLSFNP